MKTILAKWKLRLKGFIKNLFRESQNQFQSISINKVETTRQLSLVPDNAFSQQEYDAFRMKAIVLLKKDEMLGTSLQSLLKDPVQVKIGSRENQKIVVQLSQRFEWSGRVYQFQGEFLRDPARRKHSIPLSKTFKITQSLMQ